MKPGLISYQATLGIIQEQSGPLRAATIPLAKHSPRWQRWEDRIIFAVHELAALAVLRAFG